MNTIKKLPVKKAVIRHRSKAAGIHSFPTGDGDPTSLTTLATTHYGKM